VDLLTTIGRTLGFSFAAGVNLYATVAILGFASRFQWVDLPDQFRVFDNNWIIATAVILYVVEFVADKVPWVDSMWDALHTVVRPFGAALIAVASIGPVSPAVQVMVALAGAAVASSSHLAKAGTRVAANTSPEPFSNWVLSLAEDGFVVGLGVLALKFPLIAALVVIAAVTAIAFSARWLFRRVRRLARPS
jgi:Domain of unknown function (DUF4126)